MPKPDISDPYNPQHEQQFKSNPPTDTTPLDEAMEYWQKYEELYGTPRDSNARYLMKTFLRCKKEIKLLRGTLQFLGIKDINDHLS
jgi:hypothetical protein